MAKQTHIIITFHEEVDYDLLEAVREIMGHCPENFTIKKLKDNEAITTLPIDRFPGLC
jgi:hypothetical protein